MGETNGIHGEVAPSGAAVRTALQSPTQLLSSNAIEQELRALEGRVDHLDQWAVQMSDFTESTSQVHARLFAEVREQATLAMKLAEELAKLKEAVGRTSPGASPAWSALWDDAKVWRTAAGVLGATTGAFALLAWRSSSLVREALRRAISK